MAKRKVNPAMGDAIADVGRNTRRAHSLAKYGTKSTGKSALDSGRNARAAARRARNSAKNGTR